MLRMALPSLLITLVFTGITEYSNVPVRASRGGRALVKLGVGWKRKWPPETHRRHSRGGTRASGRTEGCTTVLLDVIIVLIKAGVVLFGLLNLAGLLTWA